MELRKARRIAAEIAELMQPYCERIQQAGSIRRECLQVKDIELVCIPKWEARPNPTSLFGETVPTNLLYEAMQSPKIDDLRIEWIKPGVTEVIPWGIRPNGKYWRGLVAGADGNGPIEPIKLDLFIAKPENYGVIFAIRTGSADFSRALVTYIRDHTEYRVEGGNLLRGERVRLCMEERTLFERAGLKFVEPHLRRSDKDVQPL